MIFIPSYNRVLKFGILLLILKTFFGYTRIFEYSYLFDTILTFTSTLCLALAILKNHYTKKAFITYIFITVISLLICYRVGSFQLLITTMTILAIRGTETDNVIEYIFKCESFIFTIHTLVALILILFGNQYYMVIQGTVRYTLGFVHPNVLAIILYNIICMWIWLNFERIKTRHFVVIIIVGIILYELTKTRTAMMEIILLIILLIISRKKTNHKMLQVASGIIFPIISVAVYLCIANYKTGNAIILAIDKLISGRIKLGAYAYDIRGLSFWGQNFSDFVANYDSYWKMTNKFTFDNIYSFFLINYGIFLILVISSSFYVLSNLKNNKINIFIILWSLYDITEGHGLSCYSFFPILLISILLNNHNNYAISDIRIVSKSNNKQEYKYHLGK